MLSPIHVENSGPLLGANLFSYTYSNTRNNLDLSQGKCFALVQNALDR